MLQVNVSGNITADATIKNINGKSCISFTVANNTKQQSADGTPIIKTDFLNCSVWNRPNVASLFFKGRPVFLSGLLSIKKSNGSTFLNVTVQEFQVFGKAKQTVLPETVFIDKYFDEPETNRQNAAQQEPADILEPGTHAINLPF